MRGWLKPGVAALLLGGCSVFAPKPVQPIAGVSAADQAACNAQAENDPAVKLLIVRQLGSEHLLVTTQGELQGAKREAALRCLQGRGALAPGGVERQAPLN